MRGPIEFSKFGYAGGIFAIIAGLIWITAVVLIIVAVVKALKYSKQRVEKLDSIDQKLGQMMDYLKHKVKE